MSVLLPTVKTGDWVGMQRAFQKISLLFGPDSTPTFSGLTLSSLTAGSVIFAGTGGVLSQDNTNLFWDDANNRLGIGTATPAYALDVASRSQLAGANLTQTLEIHNNTGYNAQNQTIIVTRSNDANASNVILLGKSSGSVGSETDVASGHTFGSYGFAGYNENAVGGADYVNSAAINAVAENTPVASGAVPSKLVFYTTAPGGALQEAMSIDQNKKLTVVGALDVGGDFTVTGTTQFTGNVGIGVAPDANERLYISGPTAANAIVQINAEDATSASVRFTTTDVDWYVQAGTVSGLDGYRWYDSAVGYRMILDENGYLGIGDLTPSYHLDVAGSIALTGDLRLTTGMDVGVQGSNALFTFNSPTAGTIYQGGPLQIGSYSDPGGTVPSSRSYFISTNSPQLTLVYDGTHWASFTVSAAGVLTIGHSSGQITTTATVTVGSLVSSGAVSGTTITGNTVSATTNVTAGTSLIVGSMTINTNLITNPGSFSLITTSGNIYFKHSSSFFAYMVASTGRTGIGNGAYPPNVTLDVKGDFRAGGFSDNYLHVSTVGDTYWVGDSTGLVYGSMYADDISETVTVAASSTWYEVGGGNFTSGQLNLVTFANNEELVVGVAGRYKIDWGMDLETAAANQYLEGTVMINGTANVQAVGTVDIATANKKGHVSGTCILDLAASAVVSLCVSNETSTQDIIVSHGNMSLIQIGGT